MNRLKFVLESRGIWNSAERLRQVVSRFGPTASRMERRLAAYSDIVAAHGSRPTLPITARVMDRNPAVARRLLDRGAELCVHALVHNDLSRLAPEEQDRQIKAACALFQKHGIAYSGFRSPYLKYNKATLNVVEAAGFDYDSNLPFYWNPRGSLSGLGPREKDGLDRGLAFYSPSTRATDRSLPRLIGKLVEIPVSLPDDEILLDRMNLPPESVRQTWLEMLELASREGDLLTLQLHPERLEILNSALESLLDSAASLGTVWLATLGEISKWWRSRVSANLAVTPVGAGEYVINGSRTDSEMSVYEPSSGRRVGLAPGGRVTAARKPLIGLDPKTDPSFAIKIREMGYFFEYARDRAAYPLFFDATNLPSGSLEEAIRKCDSPLVKESVWPGPHKSALSVTGDIDCLTLGDFLRRTWEG